MPKQHRFVRSSFFTSVSLVPLLLAGCAATVTRGPSSSPLPDVATGNWQFSSTAATAAHLPSFSGELSGSSNALSGILHSQSATGCTAPGTAFEVAGSADQTGLVTLSGPVANGTLTITGTLSEDGKSLTGVSYNVVGGACAFSQKAVGTAEFFTPINGNYSGSFSDVDGQVAQVTANFSQSSTPDANGNFTLAGTATVSNNPCFPTAVPVSNTQVTGGMFTFTYSANGNSVTANGTFAADATTLTVSSWTSSGTCGADTGMQSIMTRQGS